MTTIQFLSGMPTNGGGDGLTVELIFEQPRRHAQLGEAIAASAGVEPFELREAFGRNSGDYWFVEFPGRSSDGREPDGFELARRLARATGAIEGNLVPTDSLIGAVAAVGAPEAMVGGLCSTPEAEHDKAWPHRVVGIESAWARTRGAGVRIAHIDTGYSDHDELHDLYDFGAQANLIERDAPNDAHDRFSTNMIVSNPGHGTVVASVVASRGGIDGGATTGPGSVTGIAPEARIVPIRAIRSVVDLNQSRLPRAIRHAIDADCDVIVMCLGGPARVRSVEKALRDAVRAGLVVICAAGNCWPWAVFPARYAPHGLAVSVAAVGHGLDPWDKSPRDGPITIAAPGENVWAAAMREAGAPTDIVKPSQGTTLATSVTTGIAALWISHHGRDQLRALADARDTTVQQLFMHAVVSGAHRPAHWDAKDIRRTGAGIVSAGAVLDFAIEVESFAGGVEPAPSATPLPTVALLREHVAQGDPEAAAEVDDSLADVASELIWRRQVAGAGGDAIGWAPHLEAAIARPPLSPGAEIALAGKPALRHAIEAGIR